MCVFFSMLIHLKFLVFHQISFDSSTFFNFLMFYRNKKNKSYKQWFPSEIAFDLKKP